MSKTRRSTAQWLSLLVESIPTPGACQLRHLAIARRRDTLLIMRKQRDLQVCIALVRAWLTRDGLKPEQRDALARVLEELRQLRRVQRLEKQDVYEAVRLITEILFDVFSDR
jgi:hypothetical protein